MTRCPFCRKEVAEDQLRIDWELKKVMFCELCENDYIDECLQAEGYQRETD